MVRIALRAGEGYAGRFYERDMAAVASQQSARWGKQTESNSPSEKGQEAKERKQKCQSGKKEKTERDQREGANEVICQEGAGREVLQANQLVFVVWGLHSVA